MKTIKYFFLTKFIICAKLSLILKILKIQIFNKNCHNLMFTAPIKIHSNFKENTVMCDIHCMYVVFENKFRMEAQIK